MLRSVVASPQYTVIQSEPQAVPYVAWPCFAAGIGIAILAAKLELTPEWTILFVVLAFLFGVSLTLQVRVDPIQQAITRTHLLCGRWGTYRERIPFANVESICFRPFKDADSGDRVVVGIRLIDGRKLWLRTFDVDSAPLGCAALSFTKHVHAQTGFPIDESAPFPARELDEFKRDALASET